MKQVFTKKWFEASGVRLIKTFAQSLIAAIGSAAALAQVDWKLAFSTAILAAVLSFLTSLAGLPELKSDNPDDRPDSIAHTMKDTDVAMTEDEIKSLNGVTDTEQSTETKDETKETEPIESVETKENEQKGGNE